MKLQLIDRAEIQTTGTAGAWDGKIHAVVESKSRAIVLLDRRLNVIARTERGRTIRYVAAVSSELRRLVCATENGFRLMDLNGHAIVVDEGDEMVDDCAALFLENRGQLLTINPRRSPRSVEVRDANSGVILHQVELGGARGTYFVLGRVSDDSVLVSWRAGDHGLGHCMVELSTRRCGPHAPGFAWDVASDGAAATIEGEGESTEFGAIVLDLRSGTSRRVERQGVIRQGEEFLWAPRFLTGSHRLLLGVGEASTKGTCHFGILDLATSRYDWARAPTEIYEPRGVRRLRDDVFSVRYYDKQKRGWLAVFEVHS